MAKHTSMLLKMTCVELNKHTPLPYDYSNQLGAGAI